MSVTYLCPKCHKDNQVAQITLSGANGISPIWKCRRCNQTTPRDNWGLASDQTPANIVAFYEGAGKKESVLQKLPRALVRKNTFAGGNYANIRRATVLDVNNNVGAFEEVAIFNRQEHFMLRGRFYTPANLLRSQVVLLLSGSGGVAADQLNKVVSRYLSKVGVHVLMVDYRGFGRSDRKSPSSKGLYVDAQAMFDYLIKPKDQGGRAYNPDDVVIHGYSIGTGVAADLARTRVASYAGLILQCPFQSAAKQAEGVGRDMAGGFGAAVAKGLSSSGTKMEVETKIAGVSQPILLLIANQDADMKADGDAIAATYAAKTNLTVGRYDGEHLQPENAFHVGNKPMVSGTTGLPVAGPATTAGIGGYVNNAKNDSRLPGKPANVKASTGAGCLGVITAYYDGL